MKIRAFSIIAALGLIPALAPARLQGHPCFCNFRFGQSCHGFDLSSPEPWRLGRTGTLRAGPAESGASIVYLIGAPLRSPVPLDAFGAPGCWQHVAPSTTLAATASSGFGRLGLPVPDVRALIGASLATQAVAAFRRAPSLRVSNGYSIAITTGAPSAPSPDYHTLARHAFGCNDSRSRGSNAELLDDFVAYYTRLTASDRARDPRRASSHLRHPISGEHADVVVNLPGRGFLELGRATSFLPVWVAANNSRTSLPELVSRAGGDGDTVRPDRINRYSYARIVDASDSAVVVHWRYIPDFVDPSPTGVVHELFTIRRDGSVTRRVHRSAPTLEQAAGRTHNLQQALTLTATGLTASPATPTTRNVPGGYPGKTPVTSNPLRAALSLSFDEGLAPNGGGRTARDSVSGRDAAVEGRLANWHPGVSGTALAFDGYTSAVTLPAGATPDVSGSFTISCWVALAAYPFGTVQLAGRASPHGHDAYAAPEFEFESVYIGDPVTGRPSSRQVSVGGTGYLLAVDAFGRASLGANLDGRWTSITAPLPSRMPLHRWVHVIGVYDAGSGQMTLYRDGVRVAASRSAAGAVVTDRDVDFVVGLNREPLYMTGAIGMHTEALAASRFGVEGLIDEVRLYGRALTAAEVATSTAAGTRTAPTLAPRRLPAVGGDAFDATCTTLRYHKLWDELFHDSGYDDVVVTFDRAPERKIAFWKGMTYGPAWLKPHRTTGRDIWSHDQSIESPDDDHGLCEHMADKQVRHAHARVLERTAARVVVHWRYAVVAPTYRLAATANEMSWVDEYYTIYSDGTTVRRIQDWLCNTGRPTPLGWQGCYVLTPPGSAPRDVIDDSVATVVDAAGRTGVLSVVNATPRDQLIADPRPLWTNTRSRDRLFRGVPNGGGVTYYPELLSSWTPGDPSEPDELPSVYSPYHTFNHYPVCQVGDDGRVAMFADRVSHSEGWLDVDARDTMLYGFAPTPTEALPLVNFWNGPALVDRATARYLGYRAGEHAYAFEGEVTSLAFRLTADPNRPRAADGIPSVGIVVHEWDGGESPVVRVDGQPVATARTDVHFNRGVRTLVVWLPMRNQLAASVTIG